MNCNCELSILVAFGMEPADPLILSTSHSVLELFYAHDLSFLPVIYDRLYGELRYEELFVLNSLQPSSDLFH